MIGRVAGLEEAGTLTASEHDPDWWRGQESNDPGHFSAVGCSGVG